MNFNEYIKRMSIGYDLIKTAIETKQRESNLLTLQNIKDQFYVELASDSTICMSFEEYVRELYTPVYDAELNFLGYEHGRSLSDDEKLNRSN